MVHFLKEINELQQHFQAYDVDCNGSIDADELRTVVNNLGENISRVKLMALINEVDLDGNHTIEFNEFLSLMVRIRNGTAKKSGMAKIVKKTASQYHVKGSGHLDVDNIQEQFLRISQLTNNEFVNEQINFFELTDLNGLQSLFKKNKKEFIVFICKKTDAFRINLEVEEHPEPYSYSNEDSCIKTINFNFKVIIDKLEQDK